MSSHAPVAQWIRALASGAKGHRFESCRAYRRGWALCPSPSVCPDASIPPSSRPSSKRTRRNPMRSVGFPRFTNPVGRTEGDGPYVRPLPRARATMGVCDLLEQTPRNPMRSVGFPPCPSFAKRTLIATARPRADPTDVCACWRKLQGTRSVLRVPNPVGCSETLRATTQSGFPTRSAERQSRAACALHQRLGSPASDHATPGGYT